MHIYIQAEKQHAQKHISKTHVPVTTQPACELGSSDVLPAHMPYIFRHCLLVLKFIITIIIDNFCIALFSMRYELTALTHSTYDLSTTVLKNKTHTDIYIHTHSHKHTYTRTHVHACTYISTSVHQYLILHPSFLVNIRNPQ